MDQNFKTIHTKQQLYDHNKNQVEGAYHELNKRYAVHWVSIGNDKTGSPTLYTSLNIEDLKKHLRVVLSVLETSKPTILFNDKLTN